MSKPIRVVILPHESVVASLLRDAGSFAVIAGLFWLNHNHLGDHWAVYVISTFIGLTFLVTASKRLLPLAGVFTDPADAVAYIESQTRQEREA